MGKEIRLDAPQELKAYISRESELLNRYAELINRESKELSSLEKLIAQTTQLVNDRKRNVYASIEQTRRQEDSEAKQKALRELQKKLERYEKQVQTMKLCSEELLSARREYQVLIKDSTLLSDTGRVLSGKLQQLIDKIIEAM